MRDLKGVACLLGIVAKCFFILVVFGIVLPNILDFLLFYIYKGTGDIHNSIFVNKGYNRKNFIDIFIHIFRKYITL